MLKNTIVTLTLYVVVFFSFAMVAVADSPPDPLEYFTAGDAGSEFVRLGANFGNVAISDDGQYLAIGAPFEMHGRLPDVIQKAGAVYIYYRENGDWVFQTRLIADDPGENDHFGCVALSDKAEYLVVGANQKTSGDTGQAHVFQRFGSGLDAIWNEKALLRETNVVPGGLFGCGTAIEGADGNFTILVAAKYDGREQGTREGRVYVYTGSGSSWPEPDILTADIPEEGDVFGHSVSLELDGNLAAIGSKFGNCTGSANDDNEGAVFIFTRSGNTWSDPVKLCDPEGENLDWFGFSVALDVNDTGEVTLVAGAPHDDIDPNKPDNVGAALIFIRNELLIWDHKETLYANVRKPGDRFGKKVDIANDGTSVLVSAPYRDILMVGDDVGSAYYFTYDGFAWGEPDYVINASGGGAFDYFGYSLSMSGEGEIGLIGAPHHNVGPVGEEVGNAGAAYLFGLE